MLSSLRQIYSRSTLWIALVILLSCELLVRSGAYNFLLRPDSHAGQSVQKMRSLDAFETRHSHTPRWITFGSSVAVYGIDHGALAIEARKHGVEHINLSMPGSTLLMLRTWQTALQQNRSKILGALLVLQPDSYRTINNGSYEMGIVAPIRPSFDFANATIEEHIPWQSDQMETWGNYSQLMAYRLDLQELLGNPLQRSRQLAWWHQHAAGHDFLQRGIVDTADLCGLDLSAPELCLASAKPAGMKPEIFQALRTDCQNIAHQKVLADQDDQNAPETLQRIRALHGEIASAWLPTLVVQIPMHPIWQFREPKNAAQLRRQLQLSLQDQGARILDLDALFLSTERPVCHYFRDLWHLNQNGQQLVTEKLLAELAKLYPQNATEANYDHR